MLIRTPEGTQGTQERRGEIHHDPIGVPNINNVNTWDTDSVVALAPVIVAAPEIAALSRNVGRRLSLVKMGILSAALMLPNLGVAQTAAFRPLAGASAPADPMDNMTEVQMDKLDINKKLIDADRGKEKLIAEHTPGMEMPIEKIKQYIDEILKRAERTKHGVHMQEHENAMWVIDYFNQTKSTDARVLYYPSKVGDDSHFVQAFKKAKKGHGGYVENKVQVPTKDGPQLIPIYMDTENESIKTLPKERAVRAAVDVGTAYVILPKGTPIIEQTKIVNGKEVKTYLIAACRNEILQALSECPPASKVLSAK